METQQFEKIKKRFALNNSYFKNRRPQDPSTPYEVVEYFEQWAELPYNAEPTGDWLYDCFCEYQKRAGVVNSQFFTPTKTAERMVDLLFEQGYYYNEMIFEPCCGFGQITKQLINEKCENLIVFDNDSKMVDLINHFYGNTIDAYKSDFKDFDRYKTSFIISNPPYEVKTLTDFLEWMLERLYDNGIAVLLIPSGFLDKQRPANLVKILNNFSILHREQMIEKFERTNTTAEIVVLQKI